jgi:hypothetical protein
MSYRLRAFALLALILIVALSFAGGAVAIEPVLGPGVSALFLQAVTADAHPVSPAFFAAPALRALFASGRIARASLPHCAR